MKNEELSICQKRKEIVDYMVFIVREFAKAKNKTIKDAFDYLSKHKAINFLETTYEGEHITSLQNILEDVTQICLHNGGDIL